MKLFLWVFVVALGFAGLRPAFAAEVYSTTLSLDPTYDAAGCTWVTQNGYAGSDRQLFIPSVSAYYTIDSYTGSSTSWFISVEAFDTNQRLDQQALAVDPSWDSSRASQVYLTSGSRYYIWAAFTGGYGFAAGPTPPSGGALTNCQADGATESVSMRIVGED